MCLLVLAWQTHPRYRLVVAANRDEYHERPAAPLAPRPPPGEILAGRDLRAGGTWLGLDRARRFGVVTNFRELQRPKPHAPSRGELIPRYLGAHGGSAGSAADFFAALASDGEHYSGFNLLLADGSSMWYGSNRAAGFARELPPGVYGLSNELLDTPWPKLQRGRAGFEAWLGGSPPPPSAAPFVHHPVYGTRCSTVVLLQHSGALYIAERRFDAGGESSGETEFTLNAGSWA